MNKDRWPGIRRLEASDLAQPLAQDDRALGLRDGDFEQRRPLRGQITKREIRAVSLYNLGLKSGSVVWDIGAGSGSISVEAACIAREGHVFAIEKDIASLPLLNSNVERFGCGRVTVIEGTAPRALAIVPDPDSIFMGGSGGNLESILEVCAQRLKPAGRFVANFATIERTNDTLKWFQGEGFLAEVSMINAARSKALPDGTIRFEALNPVFIFSAWREQSSREGGTNG